jgi:hypothetical protein
MRVANIERKRLTGLLVMTLLCVWFGACGDASKNVRSSSQAASKPIATAATSGAIVSNPTLHRRAKPDNDGDGDNGNDDDRWGSATSATDRRAVVSLVKHYYAVAAAGDGARGCALIYSLLAEEIPELYGEPPGPPSLRGGTCAVVMSKVYRQKHRQLVAKIATIDVIGVRVKRLRGLALLRFKGSPERDIPVHREHHAWRIDALLDGGLG